MPQPTKNHMELLPLEILHEILGHVRFPGMLNFGIAARGGPLATALAADPKWGVTWSICNGDRLQDYAKLWSFWGSEVGKSFYGLDTRFRYHWTVNPDGFPFDDSDPGDFLRYYCSTGHQDNAERLFQRVTMHIMEMVSMIDRDDLSDFVFSRDVLSERDIRQLAPWPRSLVYDYSTARQRCSRDGNLRETLFLALHGEGAWVTESVPAALAEAGKSVVTTSMTASSCTFGSLGRLLTWSGI
ncbi:hypothetical protein OQA88_14 [Cercophora sp. LCS_1]